jgi:transcriptional regulator with XRE-family HTH domain
VGTANQLRPKRLGQKLAAIRRQLQLSQNELIRKLGFGNVLLREEISSFERDIRVPPPLVLLEYAKLVNVHVDDLLDDQVELPKRLPAGLKSRGSGRARTALSKHAKGRDKKFR